MLSVLKILEMAWLAICVFSLVMGAYLFNTQGWEASQWFFGGAFMAAMFYAFRRRMRLRMEREAAEQKDRE
ncbi:MAG: hypothetical protein K9J06_10445 [Flavobacteriales bacterium]|nr:hypothetical protein [Flavobacteriales bacterium]